MAANYTGSSPDVSVKTNHTVGIVNFGPNSTLGVATLHDNGTIEDGLSSSDSSAPGAADQKPMNLVPLEGTLVFGIPGIDERNASEVPDSRYAAIKRDEEVEPEVKIVEINPFNWTTTSPTVLPEIKLSVNKTYDDVCRMNRLHISALRATDQWLGSTFGMECKYANKALLPEHWTMHFPSETGKSKDPDFAFICHSPAEQYEPLWLLLTDFHPKTGETDLKTVVEVPILPFPVSKYTQEGVKHIHHYNTDRHWRPFVIAWTSITLGMLFLFLAAATWYLLRAAKRLKQKIRQNKAPQVNTPQVSTPQVSTPQVSTPQVSDPPRSPLAEEVVVKETQPEDHV